MNKVLIGRMTRYVTWPPRKKTVLELSYVVSGCMRVRAGNEVILVKAGEFFMPNQYTMPSCCPLGETDIVFSIVMKTQFLEQICIRPEPSDQDHFQCHLHRVAAEQAV